MHACVGVERGLNDSARSHRGAKRLSNHDYGIIFPAVPVEES